MKKQTIAAITGAALLIAGAILLAGSAKAENFDKTSLTVVASSTTLDYKLHSNNVDGLTGVSAGLSLLPYSYGQVDANVYVELGYNRTDETLSLDAEYRAQTNVGESVLVYGALGTTYTVDAGSNNESHWDANPYIGVSYDVNRKLTAFTEVGNSWDASDSWKNEGGYTQLGARYAVTDTIYVKPSVTRTFDTDANDTQAALEVGFAF